MSCERVSGSADDRYRQQRRRQLLPASSSWAWERGLASLRIGERRDEKKNEGVGLSALEFDRLTSEHLNSVYYFNRI